MRLLWSHNLIHEFGKLTRADPYRFIKNIFFIF